MIIGNGDIAKSIKDREDLLFFASGVSNSSEVEESEYKRETDLLLGQDKNAHVVYFSSLSIFYSNSRYAKHKRQMEELVKGFKTWTIIRLGNIDWGNNPHTLINYFINKKNAGEKIEIQDVYRYIINKDELNYWIGLIPEWSCEMNVPGRRLKVKEIIKEFIK